MPSSPPNTKPAETFASKISLTEAVIESYRAERYETVRRMCERAHDAGQSIDGETYRRWHGAVHRLGDPRRCEQVRRCADDAGVIDAFEQRLWQAEELHHFTNPTFYRISDHARRGLTLDQFMQDHQAKLGQLLDAARDDANTPVRRSRLASVMDRIAPKKGRSLRDSANEVSASIGSETQVGQLSGRITWPDGRAASSITITLGLASPSDEHLPADLACLDVKDVRTTRTDDAGCYCFADVPAGPHAFLAWTLDPSEHIDATRFFRHGLHIVSGDMARHDAVIEPWHSTSGYEVADPFEPMIHDDGQAWDKAAVQRMHNPFAYDFPRQMVALELPVNGDLSADYLRLFDSSRPEQPQTLQVSQGHILCMTDLPRHSEKVLALYRAQGDVNASPASETAPSSSLSLHVAADGATAVIETGRASIRVPWGEGVGAVPPILAVRGEDRRWRGDGRFVLPDGATVKQWRVESVEEGPLLLRLKVTYTLSTGQELCYELTAHEGEAYVLVHETSVRLADDPYTQDANLTGAFEFSLAPWRGGRGYLHWMREGRGISWTDLAGDEPRLLARLQEQTPWWIPPQGFAFGMTPPNVDERDFIGVFTIRRGDWIDRDFEAIAFGPGDDNRELDWPQPEMVGSTISMITAHDEPASEAYPGGDVFFRFRLFDGERHWGLLISSVDRNDGPFKELGEVQHKNSSPRLTDFMHWRLDEVDRHARPCLLPSRDDVLAMRRKAVSPVFADAWCQIRAGTTGGAIEGVRFAVQADPLIAWRKKNEILAAAAERAPLALLGRESSNGDSYSPVGVRPITYWIEEYDLIASSGVFTAEQERTARRFFLLMGHLLTTRDFMNWNFNGRNTNFDADRLGVIGMAGLAFRGNPDADAMIQHGVDQLERALEVYCTPRSGRWYENPACYYLTSLRCRIHLASCLAHLGIYDVTAFPRLKDFLNWGIHLLTPAMPNDDRLLASSLSDSEYRDAPRTRLIAPIGDHAEFGRPLSEHFAVMAKFYRQRDPAFANRLLWAFQQCRSMTKETGRASMLLTMLDEADLAPATPDQLVSQRLEGFGAVLRDRVGEDDEFYLFCKHGPGGYRYHRTEGSIILFANGKPLIFDGGEAGETWRHSTLSFYDAHMPLCAGHVEQFVALPDFGFVQGIHADVIQPGEPIFACDDCDPRLIEVAHRRFAEPNPANIRSVFRVGLDYVIVHDDLAIDPDIRSHWHLQVMADAEQGHAASGYHFKGRFGTDLQVLLPELQPDQEAVESIEIVRHPAVGRHVPVYMRHLAVSVPAASHYTALLRPLAGDGQPLQASLIRHGGDVCGIHVRGENIDDILFMSRHHLDIQYENFHFSGRYAAIIRRDKNVTATVMGKGRLRLDDMEVISTDDVATRVLA